MKTVCFVLIMSSVAAVWGCSTHNDCALDQCCGYNVLDLLSLVKSCRPYSKLGEGCHGNLLGSSCDCEAELECVEYSGILAPFHTSKGYCAKPSENNGGFLSSLVG